MDPKLIIPLCLIILCSGCIGQSGDEEDNTGPNEDFNESFQDQLGEFDSISRPFELQYSFSSGGLLEFKPKVYFYAETLVYEINEESPTFTETRLYYSKHGENPEYALKVSFSIDPSFVATISEEAKFRSVRQFAGRECYEYRVKVKSDFDQGFAGDSNKTLDICLDAEHQYIARAEASSESNVSNNKYDDWVYRVEEFNYGVPEEIIKG